MARTLKVRAYEAPDTIGGLPLRAVPILGDVAPATITVGPLKESITLTLRPVLCE